MSRILALNLNGIRSATAKGVVSWLAASGADVICLQEVQAFPEQAPPGGRSRLSRGMVSGGASGLQRRDAVLEDQAEARHARHRLRL